MNDEVIINLAISLKDVNAVLTYLGENKYNQVAPLIAKIQTQTLSQVNTPTPKKSDV
jgi:hypothetical protein